MPEKAPSRCRCAKPDPALRRLAAAASALSDGNRLRIVRLLSAGERCVCEIWRDLLLPQNLVSHHLKALRDAGLIAVRRDGLKSIYSLDRETIRGHAAGIVGLTVPSGGCICRPPPERAAKGRPPAKRRIAK